MGVSLSKAETFFILKSTKMLRQYELVDLVKSYDTDADEDALTYVLVADNTTEYGTLTFNEDGTYTFVAKEDAATGVATFTYKATDTEDEVEGTITINVTAKPTEQPGGNEGEQPGGNEGEQPGGNENEQPVEDKGCGGSIIASLGVVLVAATGVVIIKRKEEN